MKKLSLTLGVIFYCLNPALTQNITYSYIPLSYDSNYIIRCNDIEKVYCKKSKYILYSFRLLTNNRYEKINYSRTKNTISIIKGYYEYDNEGFLYVNNREIPNKKNIKECEKYLVNESGIYKVSSTGRIANYPNFWKTKSLIYYKENYFNPYTGKYLYEKVKIRNAIKNDESCCASYTTKNNNLHNKYIELTKKILPDYTDIITNSYAAPELFIKSINNKEVTYEIDTSDSGVQKFLTTILHESIHQKTFNLSTDTTFGYYLPNSQNISVGRKNNYYESEELVESIDESEFLNLYPFMVDFIFCYLFEAQMSSNLNGIYGILSEFNAYAIETNAINQIIANSKDTSINLLREKCISKAFCIPDYYYGFNIMIGLYLEHALKYRKEFVEIFKSDIQLREAYTKINLFFEQQLRVYNQNVKSGILSENYDYTKQDGFESTLVLYNRLKPLLDEFKI
ncbi:MAG: hypothetical protein H6587_07965 [Flavobacteriales bacterium]|nr:hypothetical protein [Flavobacteriales bacterium]MCB9364488.1 hypothetical protein [Flavobacteriales bacterium]